ncbi:hypothetical protein A0J57_08150 [Sphingobium sp. 22B]|nr:hypothetical protein AXW74_11210 [Sphingobium sp. AM]KYC32957.1 hypothetical protein A0J57_08150 [Sphingobium sp. 22B]OAP30571.1 hypothetical protein A8O16_17370 [Sphingobium sp. 20006FA]
MRLDEAMAGRFLRLTLGHLTREWPYKLDQILASPDDLATPRSLHPAFYGSFDWHSCVHGWWQVMRLCRLFPHLPEVQAVDALADGTLTQEAIMGECMSLDRPVADAFERPYGWGWLLALHDELAFRPARPWAKALAPLAERIADRLAAYLPRLCYPVRSGKHDNTAFALVHALRWARRRRADLALLIEERATGWFGGDRAARPWEPSGEDFLSPTLCEAMLMREVGGERFAGWLAAFMPDPFGDDMRALTSPATVTDRTDGRLAHMDGLNLSRAWCWFSLAPFLPLPERIRDIASIHLGSALPHLADDYMGEHWLATFAVLALTADDGHVAA